MAKINFPPDAAFLSPLPAVMVSCKDTDGKANIITIAWTGVVCSNPPLVSISVRPDRYSNKVLKSAKEFAINIADESLLSELDGCGITSGKDVSKFEQFHLTQQALPHISAPGISESPITIECKVTQIIPLGSHDLFLAEVVGVVAEESCICGKGMKKIDLSKFRPVSFIQGQYIGINQILGEIGLSIKNKQ